MKENTSTIAQLVNLEPPPLLESADMPTDVLDRLAAADKMISLGRLVAGVAHEINNPSSFITINVQVLKDLYSSFISELDVRCSEQGDFPVGRLMYSQVRIDIGHLLDGIETGAHRIRDTILFLQDYSRSGAAGMEQAVDLNDVVRSAKRLLHTFIRRSTAQFEILYAESLPTLNGNFQRLVQVVVALVQNACEALPDRERAIRITMQYNQAAHMVVLWLKMRA